ncbi:MAG: hypothetical protein E7328_00250 [Clostridiales bacterium]|nr:hypothetical protein [Clostridiales bacterium]
MKNVNTTKNIDKKPLTDVEIDSMSAQCGELLHKYPKTRVRIPVVPGEGDVVECGINGYNFIIKRGATVELPEPVVELLSNAGIV